MAYLTLRPGMFLWTSPHGYQYLVDEHGTEDVSPDRQSRRGRCATHSPNEHGDESPPPEQ